jgi:hypothetical protein
MFQGNKAEINDGLIDAVNLHCTDSEVAQAARDLIVREADIIGDHRLLKLASTGLAQAASGQLLTTEGTVPEIGLQLFKKALKCLAALAAYKSNEASEALMAIHGAYSSCSSQTQVIPNRGSNLSSIQIGLYVLGRIINPSADFCANNPSDLALKSSLIDLIAFFQSTSNDIATLRRGDPLVNGGKFDVDMINKSLSAKRQSYPDCEYLFEGLSASLSTVDPNLSSWETRQLRLSDPLSAPNRSDAAAVSTPPTYDYNYTPPPLSMYDYKRYGVESNVLSILGIDTLRAAEILYCDYYSYWMGPFIAVLGPNALSEEQISSLIASTSSKQDGGVQQCKVFELAKDEILALFINGYNVRCHAKLTAEHPYLDRAVVAFIDKQKGNDGDMYFIGPVPNDPDTINLVLSPLSAGVLSTYKGISVERIAHNLTGASIPPGSRIFCVGRTFLVLPPGSKDD